MTARVLMLAAALVAVPVAAQEEPRRPAVPVRAGGLSGLEVAVGDNFFVVMDTAQRQVAVYKIDGGNLAFLGSRSLDADFTKKPADATPPSLPAGDVIGQDPPDFVRPAKSVRLQTDSAVRDSSGRWSARYAVPGSVASVYAAIKGAMAGWAVEAERGQGPPWDGADATFLRDKIRVQVSVDSRGVPPGYANVRVEESR